MTAMLIQSQKKGRKRCSFSAKTCGLLKNEIAPQGFEPRYLEPKSSVLPLDEGAILCRGLNINF